MDAEILDIGGTTYRDAVNIPLAAAFLAQSRQDHRATSQNRGARLTLFAFIPRAAKVRTLSLIMHVCNDDGIGH